jgi:hypothetical protein
MRALTKPLLYILVSFLSLITACQDQPADAVTNLDQIRPQSHQKNQKISTPTELDTLSSFLKSYANDSCQLKMASVNLDSSQQKHFLNRFSQKHFHVLCTDSLSQTFGHQEWAFKDSNQANEAFFNWLDQFNSQQPFKIGSTEKIFKQFTLIVLSNKQITCIQSTKKINYKDWVKYLSGRQLQANFKYVMLGQPRKSTKWYQYKNAQIVNL